MWRKTVCVVCSVLILLTCICVGLSPVQAGTSAVRARRLVSIVYDDSGSMEGEKWEYTSYAIQCFAAMLNKGDALDITYMSSYTEGSFSFDTSNRAQSVKEIREHSDCSGTEVGSIDTAFDALKAHNDTEVNSQYWLIVMTDGQMSGADTKINGIADTIMPNGTKPHIVFFTICDTDGSYTPSFSKSNIESKGALEADEIIDAISEIASDITGRYAVDKKDIRFIDDKTVEVRTDLPLINMGILAQRSSAKVESVVGGEENQNLKEECNVPVAAPDKHLDALTDDEKATLKGNVALYGADKGNVQEGTYTITFTDAISKDDLIIMFEPAYELRVEVYIDGVVVDDISQLCEGAVVDFEASLYEIGTDNRLALSMLPGNAEYSITLSEDGMEKMNDNDLTLEDVTLSTAETKVTAKIVIPDIGTVQDTIVIKPLAVNLSGMTAEIYYDGSERLEENGVTDGENVVYITELENNDTGVRFTLYMEGEPIDKTKALSIKNDFVRGIGADFDNYDVTVCDDGTIVVAPTKTRLPSLIYWLIHKGDSVISAEYGGQSASEVICFKMGDWTKALIDFLIKLFIIFMFLYLLWWIFGKKHFKKVGTIKVFVATSRNAEFVRRTGSTKRIHWLAASGPLNFLGPRGMRKRINGTKFCVRAASGGGYTLERVKGMRLSTGLKYPSGSEYQDKTFDFNDVVYVYDGNTYYKITV